MDSLSIFRGECGCLSAFRELVTRAVPQQINKTFLVAIRVYSSRLNDEQHDGVTNGGHGQLGALQQQTLRNANSTRNATGWAKHRLTWTSERESTLKSKLEVSPSCSEIRICCECHVSRVSCAAQHVVRSCLTSASKLDLGSTPDCSERQQTRGSVPQQLQMSCLQLFYLSSGVQSRSEERPLQPGSLSTR
jgi:hypothetical protein